jgi:hypothetical protein
VSQLKFCCGQDAAHRGSWPLRTSNIALLTGPFIGTGRTGIQFACGRAGTRESPVRKMRTSVRVPGHRPTRIFQIRPNGGGASTVVPQVEPHCGHRYSYLSPSGRTRSRRLRTGTARLQRGQASRLASIRSNAGFRCVGMALPRITPAANDANVQAAGLDQRCCQKILKPYETGSDHGSLIITKRAVATPWKGSPGPAAH